MIICAFSDQHGHLDFELPEADLYLHGGDVCPDFAAMPALQSKWINHEFVPWLRGKPFYGTWGNHDFLSRYDRGDFFRVDDWIKVKNLKIWFSPWSNTFGGWAWMRSPKELEGLYSHIPTDVDILVTHQPPYGYGDKVERLLDPSEDPHVGSKELLAVIDTIQPKVVICGHIHSGHGAYQRGDTRIYNVSIVNEAYNRVYSPTLLEVE
jgi:predicted phosphodiesterase